MQFISKGAMMKTLLYLVASILVSSAIAERVRFDNYKVFSLKVETTEQHETLNAALDGDFISWNGVNIGRQSDIMVAPHKLDAFYEMTKILNFQVELKVNNVQSLIDNEKVSAQPRMDWTSYQTYESIYAWLDTLLVTYPAILTNYVVGTTFEGRLIRAVKLSHNPGNPAIFIEANIHAREWVTSATATWLLNELLTSNDPTVVDIATNYDWFFVPVMNVDGFIYTHTNNRMWRKTRQPHSIFCTGADPNRNFDRYWRQYNGATNNPCTESFAGPYPESEVEVAAFTNFFEDIGASVKLYYSFHSYGQYLMTPFGHTADTPGNYNDLMQIGMAGREAISGRYGTNYVVGSIANVLYPASGSSIDWAYGVHNLTLLYAFEFRDTGSYGFILPAEQIIPNSLEVFDGIKAMIATASSLGYF